MIDYRNSTYCIPLENILEKKEKLRGIINQDRPRVKNYHAWISKKEENYRDKFIEIYNWKCAYCGNSTDNSPKSLMQIDHVICESSFEKEKMKNGVKVKVVDNIKAGQIGNLVFSCSDCNGWKSDHLLKDGYEEMLHPDNEKITEIFFRDDQYYIKITEMYEADSSIKMFYDKLKFNKEIRRLDYLLLELRGLCKKNKSRIEINLRLHKAIDLLMERRNNATV